MRPRLIEQLCDEARADGCALAMLFSEIGSAYYERLGFRVVPHTTSDVTVKTRDGAPAVLVRAGDERDAASVAETHARRVERYRFGLVPDADLVNYSVAKKRMLAGLDPTGRRTVEYFVTEEGYQAVAYVLLQVTRAQRPGEPEAGVWPRVAIATLKARASGRCCRCCWRGTPASARR